MSSSRINRLFTDLRERFPQAFCHPPKPLALGTKERLIASGFSERDAGLILMTWCRSPLYLKSLVIDGAVRVNLDGSEAGPVSDLDREFSREKLKQAKAQRKAAKARKTANIAANQAAREANAQKRVEKAAKQAEAKTTKVEPVAPKEPAAPVKSGGRPVLVLKKRSTT